MWELAFASAAAVNGRSDPLEEGVGIALATQPCFRHPRRSSSSATVIAKCEWVRYLSKCPKMARIELQKLIRHTRCKISRESKIYALTVDCIK